MDLYDEILEKKTKIAVVGLGYVGLPLAVEFGKIVPTIGFDINTKRVNSLKNNKDLNSEMESSELKVSKFVEYTDNSAKLKEAKFIIVAVPTPINKNKQPDLACVMNSSRTVGKNLTKGSIVVYESTVFPGVTEEICVPILEEESGLKCGKDFKVGYSPERINPGDKEHTLVNILKIVSGQDKKTLEIVAKVYGMVVKAGIYKAETIKSAEAAKVIENTQRDLNIALINELSMVFDKMGIDTKSVLDAASTKWNFINMRPGLVGGHCIGVDPYYLTYKAEEYGYHPQVILAGRRINDGMGKYIADQAVKHMILADKTVKNSKVLVMGITFKENVCDIRNSKVIDVINELLSFGIQISVTDPYADKEEVKHEYGIDLMDYDEKIKYDAIVIAVNHDVFKKNLTLAKLKNHLCCNGKKGVIIDCKWLLDKISIESSDLLYWRL